MPYAGDEIEKDPDADLPYDMSWADWLEPISDTIATSTWVVSDDSGLTTHDASKSDTVAQVWLSGGNYGKWRVTNHIVTTGGLKDDRSFFAYVRER